MVRLKLLARVNYTNVGKNAFKVICVHWLKQNFTEKYLWVAVGNLHLNTLFHAERILLKIQGTPMAKGKKKPGFYSSSQGNSTHLMIKPSHFQRNNSC